MVEATVKCVVFPTDNIVEEKVNNAPNFASLQQVFEYDAN